MKVQKLESLGFLAGGIAHDFNNLLAGIYGHINLALLNLGEANAEHHLKACLKTMERARNLTRQLLTFAKGGTPLLETQQLVPFLEETIKFALSGSDISCEYNLADSLPVCAFDRNQLSQVIDNLIINAQQAMPSGGKIEVFARVVRLQQGEHPTLPGGEYVLVSIKDYGTGIKKDDLSHIFDPFFTTKFMGHGLGLATSYSIIKRHGGCIEVDSEPGKGSIFSFYLPASQEAVRAEEEKIAKVAGGQGTILIMDDEDVILESMSSLLNHLGYQVVAKKNSTEVMAYINELVKSNNELSACFLDLTIPGDPGGKGVIGEIRRLCPDLKVFVMSGYADDQVMSNPDSFQFTASLRKPFTLAEIASLLEKHPELKEPTAGSEKQQNKKGRQNRPSCLR